MNAKLGKSDMLAQSRWLNSVSEKDFYITEEIVRNGEFKKGVFASAENSEFLQGVRGLEDLRKYKVISNNKWSVDWRTLESLELPRINATSLLTMYRMINTGRADYLLEEFRSKDSFSNTFEGVTLVAVKNLTVVLQGSRHFVVSKKSKKGERIFAALEKGIRSLRKKKLIEKAYFESGFYNERIAGWRTIEVKE